MNNLKYSPESDSPHFELFNAAFTGKLNRFKRLALEHAQGEGIGVAIAIGKIRDEDKRGCLQFAAAAGKLNVCKYLLGTLKLDVNVKDDCGRRPLYLAATNGHLETVRYLLEKGASADASDDRNQTPLQSASLIGATKIMALLLSKGVQVDAITKSGCTALEAAAIAGHQEAIKMLLDHGANPNVGGNQRTSRPLYFAIYNQSWEAVELLIQAHADPNAVSSGETPLVAAARVGRADVVTRLLEAGADPNYKTNTGVTALEMAANFCNYQVIGVLFPVTSPIPTYSDWSIAGLMRDLESDANNVQRKVHQNEMFHQAKSQGRDAFQGEQYLTALHWFEEAEEISPKDPAVLSNLSACYARLAEGDDALEYATRCMDERPEWPKAYYRLGVALNILKRYNEAADVFFKGLTLDPRNKELKEAYMNAIEAGLNSLRMG